MGQEIEGDILGDDYKGYIFKITGGNDKQGFAMKQGVLCANRVRLLLKGSKYTCFALLSPPFLFNNTQDLLKLKYRNRPLQA
jgi:hypothetical protein